MDLSKLSAEDLAALQKKLAAEKRARKSLQNPTRLSHILTKGDTVDVSIGDDEYTIAAKVVNVSRLIVAKAVESGEQIKLALEINPQSVQAALDHVAQSIDTDEVE